MKTNIKYLDEYTDEVSEYIGKVIIEVFHGIAKNIGVKNPDKFLKNKDLKISMTIALDVDEDILIERLISRGKESGRADDQDKSKIQNRFEEYNKKTSKLIEYYNNQGKF